MCIISSYYTVILLTSELKDIWAVALNLTKIIIDFLKAKPEHKFTARDIAIWIMATYPNECDKKRKRSTATVIPLNDENALLNQIVAEIGSRRPRLQKKYPEIKTTEGRPRKYYFTESSDAAELDIVENSTQILSSNSNDIVFKEYNLYPILSEFLLSEHGIYSMRIDEKRSRNSHGLGGNRWLYPDLVGLENLSQDWHHEIKDCVKQYSEKKTKLWSFEVKMLINRSNVREAFFQTVSNSSWANFGYLVANEIQGTDTLKELRILASLHGIGFIKLDSENPSESQILIMARERTDIDWNTANRLTEENKDFLNYIKLIRQFYQTNEIRPSDWDMAHEND